MKTLLAVIAAALLAFPASDEAFAKGSTGARPHYGGGKHTTPHGGKYPGGKGSSHKGGTYKNQKSGDRYGTHK